MATQQPRRWYRLSSLARLEAAEAAAAAATAGVDSNLARPNTPPAPRIPIIINRPAPPQQTALPQQQQTPLQQQPALPQTQLEPLQQPPALPQQPPAPPQQPEALQQQPAPPQQPPSLPQQQPSLLPPQQQPTLPQQQPPQQQPAPTQQQPALLQQQPAPSQQQPAMPQQQLAWPLLPPPPPSTPTPPSPPQAETQPALTITPLTLQSDIQTMTQATMLPKEPQQTAPLLETALQLEYPKIIRTSYNTPLPSLMAGQPKTMPIQPSAPNPEAEPESKSPPPPQYKTFPENEPETKSPLHPQSKTIFVAPEEKTVNTIQPPLYSDPKPETNPSPTPHSKSPSITPEKKMSVDGNRSRPPTEVKEEKQLKFITMAGDNTGAIMEFGKQHAGHNVREDGNRHGRRVEQEEEAVQEKGGMAADATKHTAAAVVNSNVQGINNSIVFNSSCTLRSPGVHITFHKRLRSHHH